MAAAIPGARLAVIEQCGHLSTMERPQAVTVLLRDWLLYDR
jgi:pimeloyl-ACP methyl ester carboxylesterase